VIYAAGMVSTAVLNAQGRFSLPVFAPVVNNVVVTGSYLLFWYMRDGADPSLDLTLGQKVVLAGGTTLGVAAFCAVPVVAAVRSGVSLRPRFDARHPAVRQVARRGAWAAVYLAMTQLMLGVVLVLANRVEGGVVAYQVAFTFFLLPHALFALPVITALYPRLSRSVAAADLDAFGRDMAAGTGAMAFFTLLATAGLLALARPLASLALFGDAAEGGIDHVALALAGLAPGLLGYGAFLFFSRAFYALGDARLPALVNAGVGVAGGAAMVVGFAMAGPRHRILAIALAHSLAQLMGAAVLLVLLARRLPRRQLSAATRPVVVSAAAAGLAVAAMQGLTVVLGDVPSSAKVVAAGTFGVGVYLALQRMAGTSIPLTTLRRGMARG
jgi:putative peptidoglycan lipid II flippase